MPGTVIGITMNPGYAGQFSRNGDCVIESKLVKTTDTASINFGDVVVLNADATGGTFSQAIGFIANGGTFAMLGAGATKPAVFAGFAARQVKSQETISTFGGASTANNQLGSFAPGVLADVLVRGSIMVSSYKAFSSNALPTAGGAVFFRTVTNGAGTAVGDLNTQADGSNTVQLTNCFWTTGVVDATNGTIEVTVTTRNIP